MKFSRFVALALLLSASAAFGQARPKTYVPKKEPVRAPAAPVQPREFVGSVLDTGQFLPDTTLLAEVEDRKVRVRDFIEAYFSSYPEYRPNTSEAGRREFLTSMVNKELLALTANAAGRKLEFEDRLTLREHQQRVLSNAVYQRMVIDSLHVSEADLRAYYELQKYDQHFRHILLADRELATKAVADLRAKRITWDAAVKRYHLGKGASDLGWVPLTGLFPETAVAIYGLEPGRISDPVPDRGFYQIYQSVERRPRNDVPAFESMRKLYLTTLQGMQMNDYAERVQVVIRDRIGISYDTSAVRWVASHFGNSLLELEAGPGGSPVLSIVDTIPDFSAADTGKVLARWNGGHMTLGPVLKAYTDITPVSRPKMNTPEAVQAQVDALVLEPYMAQLAIERGFDKDPIVIQQLERKREEMLVKHLFGDSVESKIWISKADRQAYYKSHPSNFTTYASVRFAAMTAPSRAGADSLAARLRAGEKAEDILLADSLAGLHRGSIQTRTSEDHGGYHKLLFEELRPGQVSIEGPDRTGDYLILQSLEFDPGHLLPYEQVEGLIDESMQNIRAEEALKAMLERARKRYRVVEHPELLSRVRLVDPTLD